MAPAAGSTKNKSAAPKKSSASASASKNSGKLKTHNVQHTLRAASKHKVAQRQQTQAQSTASKSGGTVASASASASGSGSSSNKNGQKAAAAAAAPPTSAPPQMPRKQVFKQVLASPLTVNWPVLSNVDAQPILYTLLDVLKHPAVVECLRNAGGDEEKKGKAKKNDKGKAKEADAPATKEQMKGKAKHQDASKSQKQSSYAVESDSSTDSTSSSPIALGINSVSRHLESMIDHQSRRRNPKDAEEQGSTSAVPSTSTTSEQQPQPPSPLNIVFVCRQDLDPPTLCAHFPMLTCAVNAVCHPRPEAGVLLVPLPAGSERLLSEAIDLRRCSVVGLSTDVLSSMGVRQPLMALLARIQEAGNSSGLKPLRASWLDSAADVILRTREYLMNRLRRADSDSESESDTKSIPPAPPAAAAVAKVKQVQSTAPANINAVKLAKKHTRQEKKDWRKAMRKDGHAKSVAKAKKGKKAQRKDRNKRRIEAGKATIAKKKKIAAQKSSQKGESSPTDVQM